MQPVSNVDAGSGRAAGAGFAAAFADFWRAPSPRRLPEILRPDVVLRQSLSSPLRGIDAAERVTLFDPLPLIAALLRHPGAWRGWLASGVARPWRSGPAVAS